jgi:mannose-6-phosphate isomerase-like protein (cupin superfamily)
MQDVAYSRLAIETREVKNASFKYAKMLSMPFFGTGIVDVPPGGVKRSKNSRKMHMCFFVYSGRVIVEVAGNKFGLAKGGLWQVPRGTLYLPFRDFRNVLSFRSCFVVAHGGWGSPPFVAAGLSLDRCPGFPHASSAEELDVLAEDAANHHRR